MTVCLAVNTANTILSLALVSGDAVVYRFACAETRDQGNLILSEAKKAVAQGGMTFDDIDLFTVVTGPGSFTGIRIGIAALRGMALAAGKPVTGVSSFDLFRAAGPADIIAIESWREELYLQYRDDEPVNQTPQDFVRARSFASSVTIAGDAAGKLAALIPGAVVAPGDLPDAVDAARLALSRGVAGEKPVPFYLRPADVTLAGGLRRIES